MASAPVPPRWVYRRRRSIAGPIVLILLGVFFLLGNLGVMGWHTLGFWFAHYWPLLLILWGVVRLVEYFYARGHDYPAPGIGVAGVFILIFLICFGLAATGAARFDWGAFQDHVDWGDSGGWTWYGHHYDYTDSLEQPFPAGQSLRINSSHGDINVLPGADGELKINIKKQVNADTQGQADRENARTRPSISVDGNTVTVNSNNETRSGWGNASASVNLDVYLPRQAAVEIDGSHGDLKVSGRDGGVRITSSHGDVTVGDVNGNAALTVNHGDLTVHRLQGDLEVDGRVNEVQIADVGGTVTLNGDYFNAAVNLSNIAKLVRFDSTRTTLQMGALPGQLTMNAGDLEVNGVSGFQMRTHSKDIHLENVNGDVSIDDRNADIEVHAGARPLGAISINNSNAPISLYLPPGAAFALQATAGEGSIESDFDAIRVSNQGDTASASGSVGRNGKHIQLNTAHADIEIRKGVAAAESAPAAPAPPTPPRHSHPAPPAPGESQT